MGEPEDGRIAAVCDGDLARLARDGDPVAFRLLVERHQRAARARAARLCANPSDVDDVVQEAFLRAYLALDRLRDPERFAGWLAGIVHNVCRAQHRRLPVTLLADWPESLHPAAPHGEPSAEDMDRSDALRAAVASLPAGQRHAVTAHYYAGLPAGQAGESPGAARASLHKARLRLRAYLAEHRPDLAHATWRSHMTAVRVARVERHIPPGPVPMRAPTHVIVLADDAGHRELPVWLLGDDGLRLSDLVEPGGEDGGTARGSGASARTPEELTDRLLRAAGTAVTGVDIDELVPEVTVARIGLAGPGGTAHVMARLPDGLAMAITAGAPIRVADAVLDRMAVPGPGGAPRLPARQIPEVPARAARELSLAYRPRYEPRNMDFAGGLAGWWLGGSFTEHPLAAHWQDYAAAADGGAAVLSAVPRPEGFAFLGQEVYADDYRGTEVTFRGQFRTEGAGRCGLFLRLRAVPDIGSARDIRGSLTEAAVLADPANVIVPIAGTLAWASHEVRAVVPDDCDTVVFGMFLAGPGRVELRAPEVTATRRA